MIVIEKENAADAAAIESLLNSGFGEERLSKTVYKLRQGPSVPSLSLVARTGFDAKIGASIRFWRCDVENGDTVMPAVVLGPLVVDPALQGKGLGRTLVARALEEADQEGWDLCLVVGEASYYSPYGFVLAEPYGFELPGPVDQPRFQVRAAPNLLQSLADKPIIRKVLPRSGKTSDVQGARGASCAA
ncbi:N-acetyltransferase [Nisaea sp.]|uniref:GNAT family N-acetyltransferase n=1 Tax=Nisaea sp. TaxID=2024842 RepID=UPI0032968BD4